MQKQIEQMPHSLTKNAQQKCFFIFFLIGPPLSPKKIKGGQAHGIKEMAAKKTEKERKKYCFAPHTQFVYMVGGSRTSRTSKNSSSSNNSSNIYRLDRFGYATC